MSSSPRIDVFIPCADERLDLLLPCLEALGEPPEGMRALVMPAAASGVVQHLAHYGPSWLEVLPFDERLTFAEINNRAIGAYAGQPVVVLMNNDVRASFGDLQRLAQPIIDGVAAAVGPKHLYPLDGELAGLVQAAGAYFIVRPDGLAPNVGWRFAHRDDPGPARSRYMPCLPFSCAAVSRDLWDALGGLDEGYRNGYEDTDFCLRGLELGARYLYAADVEVVHLESQTCAENSPFWRGGDVQRPGLQRFRQTWNTTGRGLLALGVTCG